MSSAVNIEVDAETRNTLSGLALGDLDVLGEALELREAAMESSGLDARSFALVKIAALVALDSPPASYLWQISCVLPVANLERCSRWRDAAGHPRRTACRCAAGRRATDGGSGTRDHDRARAVATRRA